MLVTFRCLASLNVYTNGLNSVSVALSSMVKFFKKLRIPTLRVWRLIYVMWVPSLHRKSTDSLILACSTLTCMISNSKSYLYIMQVQSSTAGASLLAATDLNRVCITAPLYYSECMYTLSISLALYFPLYSLLFSVLHYPCYLRKVRLTQSLLLEVQ